MRIATTRLTILHTLLNFTSFSSAALFLFQESVQDPTSHLQIFFSLMSSIFKIQQSFFVFHNLSAFKEYQTIILLLFLKLDLFDILSYLGWGHAFSAVISQELCCVLLNISYKGDHDLCLTSWDVNCDHMIKVMSFGFFTIKLPSLPL